MYFGARKVDRLGPIYDKWGPVCDTMGDGGDSLRAHPHPAANKS